MVPGGTVTGPMTAVTVCQRDGLLVGDQAEHDRWHAELDAAPQDQPDQVVEFLDGIEPAALDALVMAHMSTMGMRADPIDATLQVLRKLAAE